MKKLLFSSLLGLAALAVWAPPSQAWTFGLIPDHCCPFGWCGGCGGCCGCNRYCSTICIRPYNAFTPVCCGNMCFDGCAPTFAPCCGAPCCGFPGCGAPCGGPSMCCQSAPCCSAAPSCAPASGGCASDAPPPGGVIVPVPTTAAPPTALPTGPAPSPLPPPGMGMRPARQNTSPVQTAVYQQAQQTNPYAYAPANPYAYGYAPAYGYAQANPYAYVPMIPPTVAGYQPWYWAPGGSGR